MTVCSSTSISRLAFGAAIVCLTVSPMRAQDAPQALAAQATDKSGFERVTA